MVEKFTCIIPARSKSSRFPGKPLALILGKPMILWVVEHANQSKYLKEIIVATDSEDIFNVVTEAGYKAVYTSKDCPNGSARVAEVAQKSEDEWVFEMQGDQPMVTAKTIDDFLERALGEVKNNNEVQVVIPFAPTTREQTESPDVLKVVVTKSNRLVFQTRLPIQTGFRTLGLYLWKNEVLQSFAFLPVSSIEKIEDSHPIRLYVNDIYVQGLLINEPSWVEVDRPNQIQQVEELLGSVE